MTGFDAISGHERPVKVLRRILSSGRIAHAYLFWGPVGIGKELVARVVASTLLCADGGALGHASPCGKCPACRKMESGNHPDLHYLAPGEKAISVEEVRGLLEALAFQAYEKGRKVAIIRDAPKMSPSAANALLKTLEEPPRDTYIFLLAEHRSRLLPTLVSRCQPVRFDPLTDAEVEGVLLRRGVEPDKAAKLASVSAGSPGTALLLGETAAEGIEGEVVAIVASLDKMKVAERFELGERWAKEKDVLDLRLRWLERSLAEAARSDPSAAARLGRLERVRVLIEANINAQLALDALFVIEPGGRLEETI